MFKIGPIRIQAWTVLPLLLVAFAGFFGSHKLKFWQLAGLFLVPLYFFMALPNLATDYALVQLIQSYGYIAGIAVIFVILAIAIRILWIVRTIPNHLPNYLFLEP